MNSTDLLEKYLDNEELLALARRDVESGNLDEALLKTKILLSGNEPAFEVYSLAGRVYAQLQLWDKAIGSLKSCVEKQPEAHNEKFQLGLVYLDAGSADEALVIWDEVISAEPAHAPSLYYRALALVQQQAFEEAGETIERLLSVIPADNLYYNKAQDLKKSIEHSPVPSIQVAN